MSAPATLQVTFPNSIFSGTQITAGGIVYSNTLGIVTSTAALTNGQILIGSTGANPALGTITGNTQVIVTNGAGTIGLSLSLATAIPIGSSSPSTGAFTTLSATGQITSTLTAGTAPFVVASSTVVANLNVSQLLGATWAAPGTIGSGTPSSGAFTTLSASSTVSGTGFSTYLASPPAIGGTVAAAGTFTTLNLTGIVTINTPITASTGNGTNIFNCYGNQTYTASNQQTAIALFGSTGTLALGTGYTGISWTGVAFVAPTTVTGTSTGSSRTMLYLGGTPNISGATNYSIYSADGGATAYFQGSITPVAGIVGVTTNSNASAGIVGEFITANVAVGSAVSLTTGSPSNITSISLTAGDWDISGLGAFHPAGTTTTTYFIVSINTTSATVAAMNTGQTTIEPYAVAVTTQDPSSPIASFRLSLSATTTTVYLVAQAGFAVSTMGAYGWIGARRRR